MAERKWHWRFTGFGNTVLYCALQSHVLVSAAVGLRLTLVERHLTLGDLTVTLTVALRRSAGTPPSGTCVFVSCLLPWRKVAPSHVAAHWRQSSPPGPGLKPFYPWNLSYLSTCEVELTREAGAGGGKQVLERGKYSLGGSGRWVLTTSQKAEAHWSAKSVQYISNSWWVKSTGAEMDANHDDW